MMFRRIALAAVLVAGALMTGGATNSNWNNVVERVDGGHLIGNPDASVKLTEYVSYTCPHCAEFTREAEDALKLTYVVPGQMSIEVRHLIRDPVDLTVAMLANCGPPSKFPLNHSAFMLSQDTWIAAAEKATPAQRQRWASGDFAARRRAIASDLGLYTIMEQRGYERAEADRCLNDEKVAETISQVSDRDWKKPGITGTPAFAIDGNVLAGTHSWRMLATQLAARF